MSDSEGTMIRSADNMSGYLSSFPLVAVIVLNWNNYADTARCLKLIFQSEVDSCRLRVILVDNGSTDRSSVQLEKEYPNVMFLYTDENLGFARGNNVGIKAALELGSDFVLLLNNDVFIVDSYIRTLVAFMKENPSVGIAGGKVFFADKPDVIWSAGGRIDWWRGRFGAYGYKQINSDDLCTDVRDVDHISAAAVMIRREVLEDIGLLPECYFLGGEEADFAVQAKRSDYRVCYVPDEDAYAWHKVGYSGIRSPAYTYNRARNSLLFRERNLAGPVWMVIRWYNGLFWRVICGLLQFVSDKVRKRRKVNLLAMHDHREYREIRSEHLAKAASAIGQSIDRSRSTVTDES